MVSVFSNEVDGGSGDHDATDIGPGTLKLRQERASPVGRVYLIVVTATDAPGNLGVSCCTVVVPANQSAAASVAIEAAATQSSSYCLSHNGAPPPGYYTIGQSF